MANESYSEFVTGLQSEIERDTNIRFGIVEKHSFANVKRADNENFGEDIYMGYDKSKELYEYLVKKEYVTDLTHPIILAIQFSEKPICLIIPSTKYHSTMSYAFDMSNLRDIKPIFFLFTFQRGVCMHSKPTIALSVINLLGTKAL